MLPTPHERHPGDCLRSRSCEPGELSSRPPNISQSALAARLQTESDLSPSDYAVLLALHDVDDHRLRSSALAEHIGWQRSRLSHHLARMERRGLIDRQECSTDSRGAEIVLTAAGHAAFRRATAPHLRAIRELFIEALTPDQLTTIQDVTTALQGQLTGRT